MKLIFPIFVVWVWFAPGAIAHRAALIIANANYRHISALPNPINDARLVFDVLKQTGFGENEITLHQDLGYDEMRRALLAFKRRAAGADVALIYFAGHGFGGAENFLIPVDAEMRSWGELREEAWSQRSLEDAVSVATGLKLVILDACRNDPSGGRMAQVPSTRGIDRGLRSVEPEGGVLVAYSAKHGTVAQDGPTGGNSPFATALARHLATAGEDIRFVFGGVRDDVLRSTANEQEPYLYGSLGRERVYLVPPAGGAAESSLAPTLPAPTMPTSPRPPLSEAALTWGVVQGTSSEAVLEAYIRKFGDSVYAGFATARLEELRNQRRNAEERERANRPPPTAAYVAPQPQPRPSTGCETVLVKQAGRRPGSTIDCQKTTEPIEDLICADDDLASWDEAMTAAYKKALKETADQKAFRLAQRDWLRLRLTQCRVPPSGRYDVCDLARAKPCVLAITRERTRQLNGP